MNDQFLRSGLAAGLLFLFTHTAAAAGLFGFGGGDEKNPSIALTPAEIALNVPVPSQGEELVKLLANNGHANGLSALKDRAARKFTAELQRRLHAQLLQRFTDEEVPLVQQQANLTLRNFLDIRVNKELNDMQNADGKQVEKGYVTLSGNFRLRLDNPAGTPLREQSVDIADLHVREKYRIERMAGGISSDTTDDAISRALQEMVDDLLDRTEDQLDADALRSLVTAG
ncbi:hypothetical protein [Microbulbifer sp. SAOS-129_SWC]|uniref:hypothetical protein n=1 Tax=Microbulbifer sp. SAOS-129_SWC TaxID=3145235 RepID=UPI003217036C